MEKITRKTQAEPEGQTKKVRRLRNTTASKVITKPINDGMNTPVPDKAETHIVTESEAALFKQAENPLGNPNKI